MFLNKSLNCLFFGSFSLIVLSLAACGGSDGDDSGPGLGTAGVVSLELDDNLIEVGDGTVLRVGFSFSSSRVFDDNENVEVVVRVPEEASFRLGTAEIQVPASDNAVGAQITNCVATGEQFLLFDLDENDLALAENPSGDADAELSLTIDGDQAGESLSVQAAASSEGVPFSCGAPFPAQAEVTLSVVSLMPEMVIN